MKFGCGVCGAHFSDQFEETLKPPCNFWESIGMKDIPPEYKKKIWDAVSMIPADEIAIKTNMAVSIQFWATPIEPGVKFEELFPNYVNLSEAEKQEFQKNYFIVKNKITKKMADERNKKLPVKLIN